VYLAPRGGKPRAPDDAVRPGLAAGGYRLVIAPGQKL